MRTAKGLEVDPLVALHGQQVVLPLFVVAHKDILGIRLGVGQRDIF